jgi:rhamnulokinase
MKHIAFDLGAESGRAIVGEIINGKLETSEIHRFATQGTNVNGSLRWDVYRLFSELKEALKKYAKTYSNEPCSMGVDTWGVDYGVLDKNGKLISIPYHYRDARNIGTTKVVEEKIGLDRLYELTGIEYMEINTLNQLIAAINMDDPTIKSGEKILFMADLLQYFLSGVAKAEFCLSTTSCMFNTAESKWEDQVFDAFDIPKKLQPETVYGGQVLGNIREEIAIETGISKECKVITPATHDTACAAVAVPKLGENVAFLSSGTWSLTGLELDEANINEETKKRNIANSGGAFGKILFLKSLMGLWHIQQSRKQWLKKNPDLGYGDIVIMAKSAEPFYGIISTDDVSFLNPKNMPKAICEFMKKTGQKQPDEDDIGQIARIIFESLAFKYKASFEDLCAASDRKIDVLNIIGGGTKNKMLNQFTSNAMGIKVLAGPAEATSTGNILMQAYGAGEIKSLEELRQVVINTFKPEEYMPKDTVEWDKNYIKYKQIYTQLF